MATSVHIPVDQNLHTSYRTDREYRRRTEVAQRGEFDHARIQALLTIWFGAYNDSWRVTVLTEQWVQTADTRIGIPDLPLGPYAQSITTPTINETYSDTLQRPTDYRTMAVETIWIIDPRTRTGRHVHRRYLVRRQLPRGPRHSYPRRSPHPPQPTRSFRSPGLTSTPCAF